MKKSALIGLLAAVLCGFLAAPVMAQESETVYFRVSSWDVKRTHWATFVERFEKNTQPTLERLFDEGVITEWAISSNSVHREDGYTHSIWWSGKSLASLERVLDELREGVSPEERRKRSAELAGAINKHEDFIGRSMITKTRPTRTDEGYHFVTRSKVLPGRGREWRKMWEQYAQPTYDKLLENGTIYGYGIARQHIHTADPRYRFVWHAVPNLEAEGKVRAALREAFQSRSESEREVFFAAIASVADRSEHRDEMRRLIYYAVK